MSFIALNNEGLTNKKTWAKDQHMLDKIDQHAQNYPFLPNLRGDIGFILWPDLKYDRLAKVSLEVTRQPAFSDHLAEKADYRIQTIDLAVRVQKWGANVASNGAKLQTGQQISLERYVPMIAVGSNASAVQLKRKFLTLQIGINAATPAPLAICFSAELRGYVPVYSAHVSPYGAIPLSLDRAPDNDLCHHRCFVLLLAEELIQHMHRTESLGINYCLGQWKATRSDDLIIAGKESLPWAYVYISRHGHLRFRDKNTSLRQIPASFDHSMSELDLERDGLRYFRTQEALQSALIKDIVEFGLDIPIYRGASANDGKVPDEVTERKKALKGMLLSGAASHLFSHAMKELSFHPLPRGIDVVAGSKGYAEWFGSRSDACSVDEIDHRVSVIPSGERTFRDGRLTVFISSSAANKMKHLPRGCRQGLCVLVTFHPRVRQRIRVLCSFRVVDFDKIRYDVGSEVRIIGPKGRRRAEANFSSDRFSIAPNSWTDPALRELERDYELGTAIIAPQTMRGALGYDFNDKSIQCEMEWVVAGGPGLWQSVSFALLGWQETYARVTKLPIEDMEKNICRLASSTIDVLGCQPGMQIVAEYAVPGPNGFELRRRRIRALVATQEHLSTMRSNPGFQASLAARYVDSRALLGNNDEYQIVMLDRSFRTDLLHMEEDCSFPDDGPDSFLQSVRIRRSNRGILKEEAILLGLSLVLSTISIQSVLKDLLPCLTPLTRLVVSACAALVLISAIVVFKRRRTTDKFNRHAAGSRLARLRAAMWFH